MYIVILLFSYTSAHLTLRTSTRSSTRLPALDIDIFYILKSYI